MTLVFISLDWLRAGSGFLGGTCDCAESWTDGVTSVCQCLSVRSHRQICLRATVLPQAYMQRQARSSGTPEICTLNGFRDEHVRFGPQLCAKFGVMITYESTARPCYTSLVATDVWFWETVSHLTNSKVFSIIIETYSLVRDFSSFIYPINSKHRPPTGAHLPTGYPFLFPFIITFHSYQEEIIVFVQ